MLPLWHLLLALAPANLTVVSGDEGGLSRALAQAEAGAVITVEGGVWRGSFMINTPLTLIGKNGATLDGGGEGTVLSILAPDVTVRGLTITGSGRRLDAENSGVSVEAPRATIEDNILNEVLFGLYLKSSPQSVVRNNRITGFPIAVPRRGDPIRIWESDGTQVVGNVVESGRDVVLWFSSDLVVMNNSISNGRYGLHFMYCDGAKVIENAFINNSVGAFLMFSRDLRMENNLFLGNYGPSGYGVGLKDVDDALVADNLFLGNRVGVHMDNSPRQVDSIGHVHHNVFSRNTLGISLMPSVRNNAFWANAFLENDEQVLIAGRGGYAASNSWSHNGVGNYWSDYRGFDGDGDGLGDYPYRSDRLFESIMARYPTLRLFVNTPAARALDYAARAFPLVAPRPILEDNYPLIEMPPIPPAPKPPMPNGGPLTAAAGGILLLAVTLGFLGKESFLGGSP
ncbi:nitrous oxide reductase family maturation protein NosD [bacterium]|nr:nitrous oxide reductase family maturation protein NosD [bacterium]